MPTIGSAKKVLGISVGERSLIVAEVACVGPAVVTRLAEFSYPADLSLEQPTELGTALADFLGPHGFLTRQAVFGVPAKWLFLKSHSIPPTDPKTAANILSLHAEERLGPEFGQMVFDFTSEISFAEPTDVLLMGLQRKWLDRLMRVADAAKLNVLAITPSGDALCATAWSHLDQSLTLSLRPDGAELIERKGRHVRSLRHIGPATAVKSLVTELRRTAVVASAKSETNQEPPRLVLWDELGLDSSVHDELSNSAGMPVVQGDVQWLGATMLEQAEGQKGACAVAAGMAMREARRPRVDFLHSKLEQRKSRSSLWRTAWISTAAAVLITVLAALGDAASLQRQISQTDVHLASLKPQLDIAKPFLANTQFIESFQSTRPRYLAAIRDVALAIPPQDMQTRLTSFTLRANMTGLFSGRSDNEQNVIGLMDKLRASGKFADLRRKLDQHAARGGGPAESAFIVTFTYIPQK